MQVILDGRKSGGGQLGNIKQPSVYLGVFIWGEVYWGFDRKRYAIIVWGRFSGQLR